MFTAWTEVPGLRNKLFWLNPKDKTSGGLYTFINVEYMKEYMNTDLFKKVKDYSCVKNLTWEVHENLAGG